MEREPHGRIGFPDGGVFRISVTGGDAERLTDLKGVPHGILLGMVWAGPHRRTAVASRYRNQRYLRTHAGTEIIVWQVLTNVAIRQYCGQIIVMFRFAPANSQFVSKQQGIRSLKGLLHECL